MSTYNPAKDSLYYRPGGTPTPSATQQPRPRTYRADQHGPVFEQEPENPWLRKPVSVEEHLQYEAAQEQIEERVLANLLEQARVALCDPPTRLWQPIKRRYAADGHKPPAQQFYRRVAAAANRAMAREWERIADEVETQYKKGDDA